MSRLEIGFLIAFALLPACGRPPPKALHTSRLNSTASPTVAPGLFTATPSRPPSAKLLHPETSAPHAFIPCGYSTPKDVTPKGLRVRLTLTKTAFHRGETVRGELEIQNVTDQAIHIWEGFWPVGLLR